MQNLRSHWGFISDTYTLCLLCNANCCFCSMYCIFGPKTVAWCQLATSFVKIHLSTTNKRQEFPAVEVHVLIETRRAGPPPLLVPHNIILFSKNMWLVGYSAGHQRLPSQFERWNVAEKQPQIVKHWVLCESDGDIFKEQFQNLSFPKPNIHRAWAWSARVVEPPTHRVQRITLQSCSAGGEERFCKVPHGSAL